MALIVTTDLVRITDAENVTPWTSWGAGGTGAMIIEPDFFVQGSNCMSRGANAAAIKGMCVDYGAANVVDFTTGNHKDKLVYVWMRHSSPGLIDTLAAGGMRVILGSGATAPADAGGVWTAWYVDGSNTMLASDGWVCYVIDPRTMGSLAYGGTAANGGGVDRTAVRWFGGVSKWIAGAKGQTFGVDAIYIGRGEIRATGSVTTAGAGINEIAAADFDTIANRYGIITKKRGVYYIRGKVCIGDNRRLINASANWRIGVTSNVVTLDTINPHGFGVGELFNTNSVWSGSNAFMRQLDSKVIATIPTASSMTFALTTGNMGTATVPQTNVSISGVSPTIFSSYGETVVFETPVYVSGNPAAVYKSISDSSVGGTVGTDGLATYGGLAFVGNGMRPTTVNFGVIVGSAQGRSGPAFDVFRNVNLTTPARTYCTISADNMISGLNIYGTTFGNLQGPTDLSGQLLQYRDCFSNTFNGCGRIDSNMEMRNCSIVNSSVGAADGAYVWNSGTDMTNCNFANCSRAIVFESVVTPTTFSYLTFGGNTYDVRNESQGAITINYEYGTKPTTEDIGTATTTVQSSVPVTITVVDVDNNPIEFAQVGVYVGATQIINTDTDIDGVATGSWTGAVPANAVYKVRKSTTGGTRYVAVSGPGAIESGSGLSVKVVLREDPNI